MAFPVILQGSEGEQFNTYSATDARWPLGTQLVLQDGRKFRFARAGASTLAIAEVQGGILRLTTHTNMAGVATLGVAGSSTMTCTTGAAALTANQFAQGYVNISVTPDIGRLYRVDNHLANAGSAALVINLAQGYTVGTTHTTATRIDLTRNKFDAIIQYPASAANSGGVVGVACSAPTTTQYCWVATAGAASVRFSNTLVQGGPCGPGITAGTVDPLSATIATTIQQHVIGTTLNLSTGTVSTLNLTID